jgi:hypothetical protein
VKIKILDELNLLFWGAVMDEQKFDDDCLKREIVVLESEARCIDPKDSIYFKEDFLSDENLLPEQKTSDCTSLVPASSDLDFSFDSGDECLKDDSSSVVESISLTKDLEEKINDIKNIFNGIFDYTLIKLWEIGRIVDEIVVDKTGRYGKQPLTKISLVIFSQKNPSYLSKILKFYRLFPYKLLNWAVTKRMKETKRKLTWTHVVWLTTLPTTKDVKFFLKKIFQEDLTPAKLSDEIRKYCHREPKAAGRKLSVPKSFSDHLDHILKFTNNYIKLSEQVWCHRHHGMRASLVDLSFRANFADLHEKIKINLTKQRELIDVIRKHIKLLQKLTRGLRLHERIVKRARKLSTKISIKNSESLPGDNFTESEEDF